ncbi:hypothetical protein [Bacillus sp. es.034]|uniref:hypothetical protein n=1 Tax=Bacillus sp. es.034 TaxID=1761763 RepID=UPI000BF6BED8|nr:hypothetical protein [Bacillus sp. es.034]PFG03897.1 hypothetical protein ATG71_0572 [Bacillus sp. es.034]
MMERLTKKVLVLLALLIVLFQSFSLPIYASATIKPWNGNPWTGDSWEGSPWDPQQFKWEGNPWEGKSTQGNDWEGNGTEGQGTNGQGTNGQSWEGFDWSNAPWYMDPWVMNGWTPNGFQGNGTDGNPFNGNGTNGNPFVGYDTNGNPFDGNGTTGRSFEGDPTNPREGETASSFNGDPTDIKLPMGYEVFKFLGNDVIGGQVNMIGDFMEMPNSYRPNGSFFSSILLNGVKVGLGDNKWVAGLSDTHDSVLKTIDAVDAAHDYRLIKAASNLSDTADGLRGAITATGGTSSGVQGLKMMGSISKLNAVAAAVGAGYSAFELGFNGAKAYDVLNSDAAGNVKTSAVAEATGNLGELMMNAGVVTAAFPGGQAAGAVMVVGGAAIWGASKVTKLVADNWSGIKKFAKHPVKNTAKAIGKGISKVKGWFS